MRFVRVLPLSLLVLVMSGSYASRDDAASPTKLPLLRDPEVNQILTRMGLRITAQADPRGVPYTFYMIDDPKVSSFSLGGGYVYVTRGAAAAAANASEFEAMISHEVGHVVERHMEQAHSRDHERQADHDSVLYMMRAGFAPRGAATMLRKILTATPKANVAEYLQIHPLTEERLRHLEAQIAATPGSSNPKLVIDDADFQRLHARLAALP